MSACAYDRTETHRPTRDNRVDRRNPCEWCGDTKYCLRFDDGGSFCRTVGDAHQLTDSFMGGYLHRASGQDGAPPPPPRPKAPVAEPADADTLHNVYTDLLALCPLSDEHRALLTGPQHDLTDEQAARYGTLPADLERRRAVARKALSDCKVVSGATVPGFYLDKQQCQTVGYGGGILMPRRDLQGRLTGFMVRSDKPAADPRYTWLSNASADGPSSGSAAHIAQPHNLREPAKVGICEGIKKADMLAERLGYPHISINGVGTWGAALEILDALATQGVDTLVIALDRDVKPSAVEAVERARQGLAAAAAQRGYAVRIASWDPAEGKGPDDLLAAGGTWTLERYVPSLRRDPPTESAGGVGGDDTDLLAGVAPATDGSGWVTIDPRLLALLIERTMATDTLRRKYQMQNLLITDKRLKPGDKVVTAAVWDMAMPEGHDPGPAAPRKIYRAALADRTGMSLGTITRKLQDASAMGLISLESRQIAADNTELWVGVGALPDKSLTAEEVNALATQRQKDRARPRRCPGCGSTHLRATAYACLDCGQSCTDDEAVTAGETIIVTDGGAVVDSTTGEVLAPAPTRADSVGGQTPPHSDAPDAPDTTETPRAESAHLRTSGKKSWGVDSVGDTPPCGFRWGVPAEDSPAPEATPPATSWRPTPKPPVERFCHDVSPTGTACPACGGVRWRLRETPTSDGQWLWACAGCADRRAAYMAQHIPAVPLNIATAHSTSMHSAQEDDDADYFTV